MKLDPNNSRSTRVESGYGERSKRALVMHLDTIAAELKALPLTSPKRGPLIKRIRDVEDQIGSVEGI